MDGGNLGETLNEHNQWGVRIPTASGFIEYFNELDCDIRNVGRNCGHSHRSNHSADCQNREGSNHIGNYVEYNRERHWYGYWLA